MRLQNFIRCSFRPLPTARCVARARGDLDGAAVKLGAGVRDLRFGSYGLDLRDVEVNQVIKARSEQSDGRGRPAKMASTLPSLMISVPSPRTCACRVAAFGGPRDKRRTREVCINPAQGRAARDRDLRAVDPDWD